MLLSIIVPTYNCCDYLQACLEKLDKLDPSKVEIIVINDGSKDKTKDFLERNYSTKSNYVIVHQENGGISNARNTGLSKVSAEYIYFCDSDDEIIVENFSKALLQIENNNFDIFIANFENEERDKKTLKTYYNRKLYGKTTGEEFLINNLKEFTWGAECYQFFIKSSLIEGHFFIEGLVHEDDLFFPPILLKAKDVFVSDLSIYLRKFRIGSITRTESGPRRNPKDILYIINRFLELSKEQPILFQTLAIRSWISLLDYLKRNKKVENRSDIISQKPNPFKVLFDSNVLLNFRLKYFRRALRIK